MNGKNFNWENLASNSRAPARTRCTAFQDLLFVKMVRSDDGDDATTATDPRVGFRFVYFFRIGFHRVRGRVDVDRREGSTGEFWISRLIEFRARGVGSTTRLMLTLGG